MDEASNLWRMQSPERDAQCRKKKNPFKKGEKGREREGAPCVTSFESGSEDGAALHGCDGSGVKAAAGYITLILGLSFLCLFCRLPF